MSKFTKLQNNTLDILERTPTQDDSGQVFETWTPITTGVPCRKDIAPKDYVIKDDNYKNIKEKYVFFIDKKYKSLVSRYNRIQCDLQEFAITDVMSFDSVKSIHHIEIYAVLSELGTGAGYGGFTVDSNQFVKKTQKVNEKALTGDVTITIADIPNLNTELASIQTELDKKQDIATNYDDKKYQQTFTAQTSITVTHNLAKYPSVTIIDSAGDEVVGSVQHVSQNQFVVTFSSATGGTVYCN